MIPKCAGIDPANYDPSTLEHRYIRMYIGLEDPAYLIADLDQSLAKV